MIFPIPSLLDALTQIASQAGEAIMRVRTAGTAVRTKADASPVTEADEAAEAIILDGLARTLPGIVVVSEEAASTGSLPELPDTFILVDPLDGTREFIDGRDEFTVNIAIVRDGRPVSGIVGAPALSAIWRGAVGAGAERLRLPPGAAPGTRPTASPCEPPAIMAAPGARWSAVRISIPRPSNGSRGLLR